MRTAGTTVSPATKARWRNQLAIASNLALIILAGLGAIAALVYAKAFVTPVALAIVIGLMFGPVATRIENLGISPFASAALVVLLFIALIFSALAGMVLPLTEWLQKLPQLWDKVQEEVARWQGNLVALENLQREFQSVLGNDDHVVVTLDQGSTVQTAAFLAPSMAGQIVLFLATMYFFLATREGIRTTILSVCLTRRIKWRVARIFRDIEAGVSRYLLSITMINICLGTVVAGSFWIAGLPSPLLWGALAAISNYIAYVGQAFMMAILLAVGLSIGGGPSEILTPLGIYLVIALLESQLITPNVIGRLMTISPLIVFLGVTLGLWLWGPIGGFVAVPILISIGIIIKQLLQVVPPTTKAGQAATSGTTLAAPRSKEPEPVV